MFRRRGRRGAAGRDVRVIRCDERYTSRRDGITTRHSFSYGDHYDADNVAFGPLRAVNEEWLEPGAGYDSHRHSDVEIVTWVLAGALAHEDSMGARGVLRPGEVQHISARAGVEHTERNHSTTEPLHFLQMMLAPSDAELADPRPGPPAYRQWDLQGARGYLLDVLWVRDGVMLHAALLDAGDVVDLPEDGLVHLHVTRGRVEAAGETLEHGDVLRATGEGPLRVKGVTPSEILAWHLRPSTDPGAA
ncbi:pirin family protein [Mumia sp. zg.B21]|uniref:pirin family protein n=1 Tax=Mumia sp. zg.B21 TaxID=2855447 RepID=UPI001C6EBB37|nr:pirin family protein [Mumia sp. zg.B21]MBW9210381.1 pirin family protein [Mumia sp. zg.B21]